MKIRNRIFIFNTVMVLFSLVTLLAMSGALVNSFRNENINTEIAKAKLDEAPPLFLY